MQSTEKIVSPHRIWSPENFRYYPPHRIWIPENFCYYPPPLNPLGQNSDCPPQMDVGPYAYVQESTVVTRHVEC